MTAVLQRETTAIARGKFREAGRIPALSFSLASFRVFAYLECMEVHFSADVEKKLNDLAVQNGCKSANALVQAVVEGYFDELAETREMLDSRYDDIKSGKVKLIPGEEVFAELRAKSAARRAKPQ